MPNRPPSLPKPPLTSSGRTAAVWSMVTYLVGWRLGWDEAMVLSAAGLLALVLAIPLTAFFVVFWRLAQEKYIKEVV